MLKLKKKVINVKNLFRLNNINIIKSLLVKKGLKHFIGYENAKKIRPLYKLPPKMSAYRRDSDEIKYMYFLIKGDELLQKHIET